MLELNYRLVIFGKLLAYIFPTSKGPSSRTVQLLACEVYPWNSFIIMLIARSDSLLAIKIADVGPRNSIISTRSRATLTSYGGNWVRHQ